MFRRSHSTLLHTKERFKFFFRGRTYWHPFFPQTLTRTPSKHACGVSMFLKRIRAFRAVFWRPARVVDSMFPPWCRSIPRPYSDFGRESEQTYITTKQQNNGTTHAPLFSLLEATTVRGYVDHFIVASATTIAAKKNNNGRTCRFSRALFFLCVSVCSGRYYARRKKKSHRQGWQKANEG